MKQTWKTAASVIAVALASFFAFIFRHSYFAVIYIVLGLIALGDLFVTATKAIKNKA